jgi:hypothetical protein
MESRVRMGLAVSACAREANSGNFCAGTVMLVLLAGYCQSSGWGPICIDGKRDWSWNNTKHVIGVHDPPEPDRILGTRQSVHFDVGHHDQLMGVRTQPHPGSTAGEIRSRQCAVLSDRMQKRELDVLLTSASLLVSADLPQNGAHA